MTEYEIYLERQWEKDVRRQERETLLKGVCLLLGVAALVVFVVAVSQ